jgi:hypothetical protein
MERCHEPRSSGALGKSVFVGSVRLIQCARRVLKIVATRFRRFSRIVRLFFLRRVRPCAKRTLNFLDPYTLTGVFMSAALTTLISCAIFLMSFISAILAGLITILAFMSTAARRFGRRTRKWARCTRTSIESKAAEGKGCAK